METSTTTDRGFSPPQQRRSRDSLNRVLKAARELLEEGGYDALVISEVSRRAEVGVGSIYSRLGNKQGVLIAVQLEMLEEVKLESEARFGPLRGVEREVEELIPVLVAAQAEIFRGHGRLLRAFMLRADVDDEIVRLGSASSNASAISFESILLEHRDQIAHPDPELAVDVCFRMVYDTLARRVMRGPTFESARIIAWEELTTELGIACTAYLTRSAGLSRRHER